ncbi:hypothetical protein BJ742DRAFT_741543 [Cladochytrium replicatum]|nr:hypothetical protein BJ742DRAFT_741543 [Cladochytrium replicatum]
MARLGGIRGETLLLQLVWVALNVDDVGLVVVVSCSGMMELSQMGGRAARNSSVGIEILTQNEVLTHVRTEEELSPDPAALLEYMQTSSCLRRAKITFLEGNPNAPECRNSCAKLNRRLHLVSNTAVPSLAAHPPQPPLRNRTYREFQKLRGASGYKLQTTIWAHCATHPLGTYHERPFLIKPTPTKGQVHISPDSFSGHHFGKQQSSSSSNTMKNQMDYEENPSGLPLKRLKTTLQNSNLTSYVSSLSCGGHNSIIPQTSKYTSSAASCGFRCLEVLDYLGFPSTEKEI